MSISKDKISQKISFFQNQFERILDVDFDDSEQDIIKSKNSFSLVLSNRDYESLGFGLDGPGEKKIQSLFAQLSLFFEIGVLIQKQSSAIEKPQKTHWHALYSFCYGHFFDEQSQLLSRIPITQLDQIFKKTELSGFETLKCNLWIDQQKFQAFLIPLSAEVHFIALTGMAEPWLKIHLQKVQERLLKSGL
jgi:hypothetical protein